MEFIMSEILNYRCSPNDIIHKIEEYSHISIWEQIGFYSSQIFEKIIIKKQSKIPGITSIYSSDKIMISYWTLQLLSTLLLKAKNETTKKIEPIEFCHLNIMINSLEDYYQSENKDYFNKYLISQYFNQRQVDDLDYNISNTWFLYSKENTFKGTSEDNFKQATEYFQEAWEATYEKYSTMLYTVMFLTSKNGGIFTLSSLEQIFGDDYILIKTIITKLSSDIESLKQNIQKQNYNLSQFITNNFNPLKELPIIKLKTDLFLIPIFEFLVRKSNVESYYGISNLYFKKEGRWNHQFSNFFGRAIENLALQFMGNFKDKINYIPEFSFTNNKKSPEFMINENNDYFFIQQKTKGAILKSQSGNLITYQDDINKSIIEGFKQTIKLLCNHDFINKYQKLSDTKFTKQSKIFAITVTHDDFITNIHKGIKKYIHDCEYKIRNDKRKEIRDVSGLSIGQIIFFTCSTVAFQKLIYLHVKSNKSLSKIISKYLSISIRKRSKLKSSFYWDFNDYISAEHMKLRDIGEDIEYFHQTYLEKKQNYFDDYYSKKKFSMINARGSIS